MKSENPLKGLKFMLLSIIFLLLNFNLLAQDAKQITGSVTGSDGTPLPGVTVIEKGTNSGTVTDVEGNFTISVAPDATLSFSYVGMTPQEAAVTGQSSLSIMLMEDEIGLDEVIVVGYGTQKKSDITGAVTSLPKERLEKLPNNNFAQAIQGIMPGVSVINNSAGAEGGGQSIIVRGRNSITADNDPLLILDGIPYSGSYSDINPSDIESIEVLKDASAAAIYGSRGSNGVILITSKSGSTGRTNFMYNGFVGISEIANIPEMLNGPEFYQFKSDREPGSITSSETDLYNSGEWIDWIDLATRMGQKHQHTLSASGGSEKTKFYISGTYLNTKGIAINDDFERYSSFVRVDTELTPWLTLGSNTKLSYANRSGLPADFGDAFYMNPLTISHDENGDLTIYPWEEDIYWNNPLENTIAENLDKSYSIFTNNYIDIRIPSIEGLMYRLNTGLEFNLRDRAQYHGRDTRTGSTVGGSARTRNSVRTNKLIENILSYQREFGKNNLFLTGCTVLKRANMTMRI